MRSEWKVSADDATRFLRERFGSDRVEPLRQGLWSSAYRFRRGGDDLVIRFGSIRDDFDKDAFISTIAPSDLPVPRIIEIGEALGGYYAVSRYAPGRHLDGLGAEELLRVLPSLFAALNAVREADLSGTTGYGGWDKNGIGEAASWREVLLDVASEDPAREPRWRERLATASADASRAFDAGSARIRELLVHCPEERYLVHQDLLHWNVLVDDDRVTALLDWGSSIYGDFVYDVAWLTFWSPWYPAWHGVDFAREARAQYERTGLLVPHFEERLRCYELRIGVGSLNWYASRGDAVNLDLAARRIVGLL